MPEVKQSGEKKLVIHARKPENEPKRGGSRKIRIRPGLSFEQRLMRNSCLACAVLLGVLALGNLDAPWAVKAAGHVKRALTMDIRLDESLGQMQFVKKLMPESALVFFSLDAQAELLPPVRGETTHAYASDQPWLMFACEAGSPVFAPADGVVSAVSELSDGSFGVLIDHGEGMESVIAGLEGVGVQSGAEAARGEEIGSAGGEIYYELRLAGEAADPTQRLGL